MSRSLAWKFRLSCGAFCFPVCRTTYTVMDLKILRIHRGLLEAVFRMPISRRWKNDNTKRTCKTLCLGIFSCLAAGIPRHGMVRAKPWWQIYIWNADVGRGPGRIVLADDPAAQKSLSKSISPLFHCGLRRHDGWRIRTTTSPKRSHCQ